MGVTKLIYRALKHYRKVFDLILSVFFSFLYKGRSQPLPPITDSVLYVPATTLAADIRTGKLKSVDVVKAYIERIRVVQPIVNAVVDERFDEALKDAAEVDKLIRSGTVSEEQLAKEKPFLGVPITTKDAVAVKGMLQDAGLVARAGYRAPFDADSMAFMRKAGAIPLAITNVPELCMWWESYNNLHGRTNNPYNTTHICGGSSGGEGCLIASAGSIFGIGTDIGGSIRIPSFFNGIFGHKPTTGLISNKGQYPPARDILDTYLCAGPMCRYACDLLPMFKVLAGPNLHLLKLDTQVNFRDLKVYYMEDDTGSPFLTPVHKELKQAVRKVASHFQINYGVKPEKVKLRKLRSSLEMFNCKLAAADVPSFSAELAQLKGEVQASKEFLKWLLYCSAHTLPSIMLAAMEKLTPPKTHPVFKHYLEKCDELKKEFQELLSGNSIFIYPPHPEPAPYHNLPITRPFNYAYTAIFNVLGLPVCVCPMGLSTKGLPLGVQIVAGCYNDHLCLATAVEIEKAFGGWVNPGK